MKTISDHKQIDGLLKYLDDKATKAINNGLQFTIECRTDGITERQFNAGQVWFRMCADYLNKNGFYAKHPVSGNDTLWDDELFKSRVYKVLLKGWKGKDSTKDQNTKDPDEIRIAITAHLQTYYDGILLPEWPSLRG